MVALALRDPMTQLFNRRHVQATGEIGPVRVVKMEKKGKLNRRITVEFAGQKKSTKAAVDGKWSVKLDPMSASPEPRTLTIGGIKIGDKDVFLEDGLHRYVIRYRTTRQIGFFEKYDELYWNVTGNGWDFAIDSARVTITGTPGPWAGPKDVMLELARRLDRIVREVRGPEEPAYPVLLQVNVDRDPAKAGFEVGEVAAALEAIAGECGALRLDGLMTIGRLVETEAEARATFRGLRELSGALRAAGLPIGPELSMGMSEDYPLAVEEGATIVRVGRALFGERAAALPGPA